MAVTHDLPGLRQRTAKSQPVHDAVKAPLEQDQQVFTRDPRHPLRGVKSLLELLLHQAVDTPDLLLLAQADRELRKPRAGLPMRARRIVAALDGALVREAALALQKQLQPFAPAQPANG